MSTRQKGKHLTFADRKYIEKMYKLKPKGEICEHLTLNYHTLERELMAIVENEFGTLFYIEDMDEGMAPAGTVVEDGLMESIQNLRKVDRDAILRAFGGREE